MQLNNILAACLFLALSSAAFASGADRAYSEIIRLDETDENASDDIPKKCDHFIKSYPSSDRIPEIHIIAARHENSPVKALNHYTAIIRQFPKYTQILAVYRETCQILYLSSRYEESSRYAKTALSIDRSKNQTHIFSLILIHSLILSQEYDDASNCLKKYSSAIDEDERSVLSDELSLRTGGNVSNPVNAGNSRSSCELYLLGKQYELERKYDYAFSAFKDLIHQYPRSPEGMIASKRLDLLVKQSPKYTKAYLNPQKEKNEFNLEHTSPIDDIDNALAYSVLIGPLYNLAEAKNLKKEMTGSFEQIVLVKSADGFYLYVGRESSAEKAVALKIRLAEEFALNGKIAQRKEDSGREYIYGE